MQPARTIADRGRAVRTVILVTLALNLAVAIAKIAYGYYSNVLSIRADGFHSLTDSANNLVGLVGVWLSSQPPDENHPYGHHKFETVAAGVVGLSLLVMAYDVASSAISRLRFGSDTVPSIDAGAFVILAGTLAVNICVARWERVQGERLGSTFLLSDSAHTRSDVLVTLGVLATAIFIRLGHIGLDVFAAIAVSGFIAAAGVGVLRKNLGYLTDTALLDPAQIEACVLRTPGVASTHKIRTRGSPLRVYVDLHIQIAPHLDVVQAHGVTHAVIDAIKLAFPDVIDVLVHTEPALPSQPYVPLPSKEQDAPSD